MTNLRRSAQLTPEQLSRNAVHRRAIEAVIWGMPAVNTDLMYQAMAREVKGNWNQIVYWSRLLDWKNQKDPHAEPRRDLPDAVLRHRAGGTDGD